MRKFVFIALFSLLVLFFPTVVHAQAGLNGEGITEQDDGTGNTIIGVGSSIKSVNEQTRQGIEQQDKHQGNLVGTTVKQMETVVSWGVLCAIQDGCDPNLRVSGVTPLASLMNKMGDMYSPPATTGTYVAYILRDAGLNIAPPAYAQGLGFASLDPILGTWIVLRNVAFMFYVVLFLVIGFMIMARQKISSQAVVTVQQALPNIVISLLAVSFSYAIAGLMIDIMYLVMYLILGLFSNVQITVNGAQHPLKELVFDKDIFTIGATFFSVGNAFGSSYDAVRDAVVGMLGGVSNGATEFVGTISGLTFAVVFSVAILFGIFRLFFELLKTYISIIIMIVMSPLALMLGALPGNNAFGSWLKVLIANLAVFPGILLILTISYMLIQSGYNGPNDINGTLFRNGGDYTGGFLPPYIPGRGTSNSISVMVGLGVILILPELVIQIKKMLGGSGGIFEQFGNNFFSALSTGWKGGELIPGVGASNLSNWPGFNRIGGFSAGNFVKKSAVAGSAVAGGALGGVLSGAGALANVPSRVVGAATGRPTKGRLPFAGNVIEGIYRGSARFGQYASDQADDKELYAKNRADRKAGKKGYGDTSK